VETVTVPVAKSVFTMKPLVESANVTLLVPGKFRYGGIVNDTVVRVGGMSQLQAWKYCPLPFVK